MPSCNSNSPENRMTKPDPIPARLAALKSMSVPQLKSEWQTIFATTAPNNSRAFLEQRLAYRIQELTLAVRREPGACSMCWPTRSGGKMMRKSQIADPRNPVVGTRLVREWDGRRAHDHGAEGRLRLAGPPVQVAVGDRAGDHRHALERLALLRAARTSGGMIDGVSRSRSRSAGCAAPSTPANPPRKGWTGVQQPRRPARGLRGLHRQPEGRRLGALRDRYDDGGFSGGTLERPGLQQLLADIEAGLVDVVVVYKIDRLSPLADGLREAGGGVRPQRRDLRLGDAVVQHDHQSMGRLTLNILLTFAQFEREVIGERIRDKIAASRKKGHVDGRVRAARATMSKDRKLVVNEAEAATVRHIFQRFVELGSATLLARELRRAGRPQQAGSRSTRASSTSCSATASIAARRCTRAQAYPGEHQAIIDEQLWEQVHAILRQSPRKRASKPARRRPRCSRG